MKTKSGVTDPDILGSMAAVLRAARRAERIAKNTNTPLVVTSSQKSRGYRPKKKSPP
jgi:hypothetical protein